MTRDAAPVLVTEAEIPDYVDHVDLGHWKRLGLKPVGTYRPKQGVGIPLYNLAEVKRLAARCL